MIILEKEYKRIYILLFLERKSRYLPSPDTKDFVDKESTEKTENYVGPWIDGVQYLVGRRVLLEILQEHKNRQT